MKRFSRLLLTILIAVTLTLGSFDVSAIAADEPQERTSVESEDKSGEKEDGNKSEEKGDGKKSEEKEDEKKSEEKEDGNKSEEKEDEKKSEEKEDTSGKSGDQSGQSDDETKKSGDSSTTSVNGDTAKQEKAASEDGQKDTAKQEEAASESGQDSSAQKKEAASEGEQGKGAKAEVTAPDAAASEESRKAAAGTDSEPAGESGNKAAETEILEEAAASETASEERRNGGESGTNSTAANGNMPVVAAAADGRTENKTEDGDVTVTNYGVPGAISYSYGNEDGTSSSVDVGGSLNVEVNDRPKQDDSWKDYLEGAPAEAIDFIESLLPEPSSDAGGAMSLAHLDEADSSGSASASVNIGEDVTVTGIDNAMGIHIGALGENSSASADVKGDVTVSAGNEQGSEKYSTGIKAKADQGGAVSVTIGGNLDVSSANTDEAVVNGVILNNKSGSIEISVGGDLISDGSGILSYGGSNTGDSGQSTVQVKGDVEAGGAGAVILNNKATNQTAVADHDILVENVLSGDEVGVLVAEDRVEGLTGKDGEGNPVDIGGSVDITVWKIIPNENGNVAEIMNETQGDPEKTNLTSSGKAAENVEKGIKYIIKFEQPSEGGTLSVTDKDKKDLEKSHGYDVQRQDERVLLKVDLQTGYRIRAAYNGQGEKQELLMDSDGNYYIDVPKGGGVYLSVDLTDQYKVTFVDDKDNRSGVLQKGEVKYGETPSYNGREPKKKSTMKYDYSFEGWTPEINPVTGDITYTAVYDATIRKYTVTFDPAGGKLNGSTKKMSSMREYDSTVNMPGAPTREGYKFLYWKGIEYRPDEGFVVKGNTTFMAVWEEIEGENKKEEKPTKPEDDPTDPEDNPADPEVKDPEEPASSEKEEPAKEKEKKEKSDDSDDSGTYKSPKTGDESRPELWILLAAAAGIGLVSLLAGKKKSRKS